MNAGWSVPVTFTCETPAICSMTGTIELFAMAASDVSGYFFDTSASVTTVGSLGSATRIVGGAIVVGNCPCAA
jgi:hypothetical protein